MPETIRILPERINPDWLEAMYQSLTEDGKVELDEFLNAQDLEMSDDGKVSFRPLRYTMPQTSKASILFADGRTEEWQVRFTMDNTVELTNLEGKVFKTLYDLRPTSECTEAETIIDIEIHSTRSIIRF